jgi:hypothetical protein
MHKGKKILESIFLPKSRQPRAYLLTTADIRMKGHTALVEIK